MVLHTACAYFCRMHDQQKVNQAIARAWRKAWGNKDFRSKTIAGSLLLFAIMATMPYFFSHIETRKGIRLDDWFLHALPAFDVSVATFFIIWSMTLFLLFRSAQNPGIFIVALYTLIMLSLTRMLTIYLIPLNPPLGIIPLRDPLSSLFYGGPSIFISKDLFFSGHTSAQFMIFLCLEKRKDKLLALASTLLVALLVLVQHVHYTVDVIAAIVFTYFIWLLARKFVSTAGSTPLESLP